MSALAVTTVVITDTNVLGRRQLSCPVDDNYLGR